MKIAHFNKELKEWQKVRFIGHLIHVYNDKDPKKSEAEWMPLATDKVRKAIINNDPNYWINKAKKVNGK